MQLIGRPKKWPYRLPGWLHAIGSGKIAEIPEKPESIRQRKVPPNRLTWFLQDNNSSIKKRVSRVQVSKVVSKKLLSQALQIRLLILEEFPRLQKTWTHQLQIPTGVPPASVHSL